MENTEIVSNHPNKPSILDLLEKLQDMVINAKGIPFSDNCILNREEVLLLIGMISSNMPNEVKQAKWLLDRQHQVIEQAKKAANSLVSKAETKVAMMIDENEITQKAYQVSNQIIEEAMKHGEGIVQNVRSHSVSLLSELEGSLVKVLNIIQNNKAVIMESMEDENTDTSFKNKPSSASISENSIAEDRLADK